MKFIGRPIKISGLYMNRGIEMFKLLKYEFNKVFWVNINLYLIVILIGLGDVFYLTKIYGLEGSKPPTNPINKIAFIVLFLFFVFTSLFPILQSIFNLIRDYNSKTAPLEIHIPAPGWMKILAKIIVDIIYIVFGYVLSYLVLNLFVKLGPDQISKDWDEMMTNVFKMFLNNIDMRRTIFTILFTMFTFALSLLGMVALFSTIYGALRNKVKYSKGLALVLGVLFFVAFNYLNEKFQVNYEAINRMNRYELIMDDLITKTQLISSFVHAGISIVCIAVAGWILDRHYDLS